jgi:hypothetical protein
MKINNPIPVICFILIFIIIYFDKKNYHTSTLIAILVLLAISVYHFIKQRKEISKNRWITTIVIIVVSSLYFIYNLIKV